MSRGSGNSHQRQVQLQQLTTVLKETSFKVLLLEKQYARLENVFRRVPNAKIDLDEITVKQAGVTPTAIAANIKDEQTKHAEELTIEPTPPPLPFLIPHPFAEAPETNKLAPRFVEAYRLRAQAYRQKQQLTEANADLETAKRLQPK